ncbi:MAG: hypothetical protein DCC56_10840 [Anaerolineae bacterium]|nr:MAG: hypothetical protein DCC56_10840 [Anaerolineae bacterium]WKZ45677.1 MAG: DUF4870 domain-containing protein [Anaerolineales bacterium]
MTIDQTPSPNQNDKIMAALAHVSAILPFMGVIAPIIIWATQKDKSEYVAFQALQAVVYQLLMILAWFVGMGCYMASFFVTFFTIPFTGGNNGEINPALAPFFMLSFFVPFIVFGAIFIGGAIFVIYGLIGTMQVFQGKDFRYLVIGNRLDNYLKKDR